MRVDLRAAGLFVFRHWLITLFICGIVLLAMVRGSLERLFVYYPAREIEAVPSQIGLQYQDVLAATRDGINLHGWYIPRPGALYTFLIFHGNAGNISHRLEWIKMLHDLGAHVMIIDYRGYGRSEGKPLEEGLYLDALAAYGWWSKEHAAGRNKLVLIGESLGCAVAVDLAARVQVDGIVLQSGFTTAWDMAKAHMPMGLLQPVIGVRFDSASQIAKLTCPKLIIHGDRDEVVPFRLGRRLYDLALPPKEFYEVAGAGHNDLIRTASTEYTKRLRDFLSHLGP